MQCKRLVSLSAAAVVATMAPGVTAAASAASLSGAGSTLVAPLEAKWAAGFQAAGEGTVTYQAVGSGTGITNITNGLVDFGASDAPLSSAQAGACPTCEIIPWALSATAVGYHLKGVPSLKLSGNVIAQIYLGNITKWNDPQIVKLNTVTKGKGKHKHKVRPHLPNLAITPVYRSDGSGDTYAFTNFLAGVSSAWASQVGPAATSVGFPTGISGKGNAGITGILANTNGTIGYVAASYLIQQGGIGAVAVQNAAGNFEYPNIDNISAAAAAFPTVPAGNAISIANPPKSAKIAYPISTYTYAVVKPGAPNNGLLKQFIAYALTTGQAFGAKLDFAPIPNAVLTAASNTLNGL